MKLFGEQIRFAGNVLKARWALVDAGSDRGQLRDKALLAQSYRKVVICIVVSLFIAGASGAVLVYSPDEQIRKWSAAFMGAVIGYWLR